MFIPLVGLAALSGLMLCWSAMTANRWLVTPTTPEPGELPLVAVAAFFGGFMWVSNVAGPDQR